MAFPVVEDVGNGPKGLSGPPGLGDWAGEIGFGPLESDECAQLPASVDAVHPSPTASDETEHGPGDRLLPNDVESGGRASGDRPSDEMALEREQWGEKVRGERASRTRASERDSCCSGELLTQVSLPPIEAPSADTCSPTPRRGGQILPSMLFSLFGACLTGMVLEQMQVGLPWSYSSAPLTAECARPPADLACLHSHRGALHPCAHLIKSQR